MLGIHTATRNSPITATGNQCNGKQPEAQVNEQLARPAPGHRNDAAAVGHHRIGRAVLSHVGIRFGKNRPVSVVWVLLPYGDRPVYGGHCSLIHATRFR